MNWANLQFFLWNPFPVCSWQMFWEDWDVLLCVLTDRWVHLCQCGRCKDSKHPLSLWCGIVPMGNRQCSWLIWKQTLNPYSALLHLHLKPGFNVIFFALFFSPFWNGFNELPWCYSHMTLKYVKNIKGATDKMVQWAVRVNVALEIN